VRSTQSHANVHMTHNELVRKVSGYALLIHNRSEQALLSDLLVEDRALHRTGPNQAVHKHGPVLPEPIRSTHRLYDTTHWLPFSPPRHLHMPPKTKLVHTRSATPDQSKDAPASVAHTHLLVMTRVPIHIKDDHTASSHQVHTLSTRACGNQNEIGPRQGVVEDLPKDMPSGRWLQHQVAPLQQPGATHTYRLVASDLWR